MILLINYFINLINEISKYLHCFYLEYNFILIASILYYYNLKILIILTKSLY